jgi:hypothetical protein
VRLRICLAGKKKQATDDSGDISSGCVPRPPVAAGTQAARMLHSMALCMSFDLCCLVDDTRYGSPYCHVPTRKLHGEAARSFLVRLTYSFFSSEALQVSVQSLRWHSTGAAPSCRQEGKCARNGRTSSPKRGSSRKWPKAPSTSPHPIYFTSSDLFTFFVMAQI